MRNKLRFTEITLQIFENLDFFSKRLLFLLFDLEDE